MKSLGETWRTPLVCFLLTVSTLIVYWQIHRFNFINFDDPALVYKNPMVTGGLTLRGIRWGLTTSYYEYWHPLTWWSHMLDCELFGLNAGRQHLTSLAFHIANTLLLFGMLRTLTGRFARSAIVAALFALHPMHVESVAWVAERKDVLSTFFWLLSIWAYARYVQVLKNSRDQAELFYRASAVCFLLGLMSKPMVVTLPFVLLLLDYWPLNRFKTPAPATESESKGPRLKEMTRTFISLAQEKIPFFGLTLFSSLITYLNVKSAGGVASGQIVPWSFRFTNVPVSYGRYLWKLIYPVHLCVFYPIPDGWSWWLVGISVMFLLLITALVLKLFHSAPYLFSGWFMFLGMLVPTLSLVAVGPQSLADRYTYVAYIGLFIAGVWATAELSIRWRSRIAILSGLTAVILFACSILTWFQAGYWRNDFTLWSHCLAVTPDNFMAQNNLGCALYDAGRKTEAISHLVESVRSKPDYVQANFNLGKMLLDSGEFKQAAEYLIKANQLETDSADAHASLGRALYELGDFAGAEKECGIAVSLNPSNSYSLLYLARALAQENKFDDSVHYFSQLLRIDPTNAEAHYYLGSEYLKHGLIEDAISNLSEAVSLKQPYPEARIQLDRALAARSSPKPVAAP